MGCFACLAFVASSGILLCRGHFVCRELLVLFRTGLRGKGEIIGFSSERTRILWFRDLCWRTCAEPYLLFLTPSASGECVCLMCARALLLVG